MQQQQQEKRWQINKPLIIFLILLLYIFASFIWWSYLLYKNYTNKFENDVAMLEARFIENNLPVEWMYDFDQYQKLESDYKRQVWMIIGEGAVFFVLLGIAGWRIRKSFQQEINLAKQQRNFLLSITHELKSPVASAKLSIETLLKRELPKGKQEKLLSNSLQDINRLKLLVEDILLAAKFEDSSFVFSSDAFNFSEVVNEHAARYADTYEDKRNFQIKIEPEIYLKGDRHAVTSVVSNLMDNAIKYSPSQSTIELKLLRENGHAVLVVCDEGVGIPGEEKENVFKKFYRIGQEETRRTKGTGLGLFIVKEVVKGHNGKIEVEDNLPKGTRFIIKIPVYNITTDK